MGRIHVMLESHRAKGMLGDEPGFQIQVVEMTSLAAPGLAEAMLHEHVARQPESGPAQVVLYPQLNDHWTHSRRLRGYI